VPGPGPVQGASNDHLHGAHGLGEGRSDQQESGRKAGGDPDDVSAISMILVSTWLDSPELWYGRQHKDPH